MSNRGDEEYYVKSPGAQRMTTNLTRHLVNYWLEQRKYMYIFVNIYIYQVTKKGWTQHFQMRAGPINTKWIDLNHSWRSKAHKNILNSNCLSLKSSRKTVSNL